LISEVNRSLADRNELVGLFFILFSLSAIVLAEPTTKPTHSGARIWQEITPGINMLELETSHALFFKSKVTSLRIKLGRNFYSLKTLSADELGARYMSAEDATKKSKAILTINGSFFDEEKRPLGLFVSNGIVKQKLHLSGKTLGGLLLIKHDSVRIVARSDLLSVEKKGATHLQDALQAGPRLLSDNRSIEGLRDSWSSGNRSIICTSQSEKDTVILTLIHSSPFSFTIDELQQMLLNELDCKDALNLDGGGSSQLYFAIDERVIINFKGQDQVPTFLALYKK
jgi:exopolysaccharide biosynthesis protein